MQRIYHWLGRATGPTKALSFACSSSSHLVMSILLSTLHSSPHYVLRSDVCSLYSEHRLCRVLFCPPQVMGTSIKLAELSCESISSAVLSAHVGVILCDVQEDESFICCYLCLMLLEGDVHSCRWTGHPRRSSSPVQTHLSLVHTASCSLCPC